MFGSPRSNRVDTYITSPPPPSEISPLLAAELAMEYSSLRAMGNCPIGMYLTPSHETLLRWHGVFFVHRGPYAGSILRFSLIFPTSYPQTAPTVRFDSDVFHPMVDPKTKMWAPRGRLAQWRPRLDHVPHVLHSLKGSFKISALKGVTEDEAVNKHIWSLYHHSFQTFLSMTAQRSIHSSSRSSLYPSAFPSQQPLIPPSPTKKGHSRSTSMMSNASHTSQAVEEGPITFKEINEEARGRLWDGMVRSLGR